MSVLQQNRVATRVECFFCLNKSSSRLGLIVICVVIVVVVDSVRVLFKGKNCFKCSRSCYGIERMRLNIQVSSLNTYTTATINNQNQSNNNDDKNKVHNCRAKWSSFKSVVILSSQTKALTDSITVLSTNSTFWGKKIHYIDNNNKICEPKFKVKCTVHNEPSFVEWLWRKR